MLTPQEFADLIRTNRDEAFRLYFEASIAEWLEEGPEEIVRILTIWATRPENETPRILMSDEVLYELGEGRTYPYPEEDEEEEEVEE